MTLTSRVGAQAENREVFSKLEGVTVRKYDAESRARTPTTVALHSKPEKLFVAAYSIEFSVADAQVTIDTKWDASFPQPVNANQAEENRATDMERELVKEHQICPGGEGESQARENTKENPEELAATKDSQSSTFIEESPGRIPTPPLTRSDTSSKIIGHDGNEPPRPTRKALSKTDQSERPSSRPARTLPQRHVSISAHISSDTIVANRDIQMLEKTVDPVKPSRKRKYESIETEAVPEAVVVSAKKPKGASRQGNAPQASQRSRRTTTRSSQTSTKERTKVYFSSNTEVDMVPTNLKKFQKLGIERADSAMECDVLCVGKGAQLRRTANLLTAALRGKPIVTDDWLLSSIWVEKLHNPLGYQAKESMEERHYAFRWADVTARSGKGQQTWKDYDILVTSSLKRELADKFLDFKTVATLAGASRVRVLGKHSEPNGDGKSLTLGTENDEKIEDLTRKGHQCYAKDMMMLSALRGEVNWDETELMLGRVRRATSQPL